MQEYRTCSICHGSTTVPDHTNAKDSRGNYITPPNKTCPNCGGTGQERNPQYRTPSSSNTPKKATPSGGGCMLVVLSLITGILGLSVMLVLI